MIPLALCGAAPLNAGLPQGQCPPTRDPALRDPSEGAMGTWSPTLGKWQVIVVRSRSSLAWSAGQWLRCGHDAFGLSGLVVGEVPTISDSIRSL